MKDYILFYDSGVGGLSVFIKCKKILPNENYLYFVQNKFAPFGNKTKKDIQKIVCEDILNITKKYKIKLIVLACNTATCVCIEKLKKLLEIKIIGTEPAIIPAIKSECKKILVLGTNATLKHSKLLKQNNNSKLILHSCKNFATLIDKNIENLDKIMPNVENELSKYVKMNIDSIVIGCTHYSFIIPQLKKIFGNKTVFFEPNENVCKNICELLVNNKNLKGKVMVFMAKKDKELKKQIKHLIKNPE